MISIKNIHEKLMTGIQTMLVDCIIDLPYYGEFNTHLNFKQREDIKTCAVNATAKGFNFFYSSEFLERLTQKEVNFIILHEDFHLLFDHPQRTVTGNYNHKLSNIVQDMIINHIIWEDITHSFVEIPKDEQGKNMALFVPKEYEGKLVFEQLYEWMSEKKDEYDQKKKEQEGDGDQQEGEGGEGQGEGQEGDGEGQGQGGGQGKPDPNGKGKGKGKPDPNGKGEEEGDGGYGPYGKDPKNEGGSIDTHSLDKIFEDMENNNGEYMDQHIESEVSDEVKKSMVGEIKDKLAGRGLMKGDIETTLNKLTKKRKDYLKEIKRSLSNQIFGGNKFKTITKPNRRGIDGVKGRRKIKSKINVGLDTSGSMGGTFEKVLNYVFQNGIEMNFMESDTEVRWVKKLKNKRQLQTIPIVGLGGTCLQPMINHIAENFNDVNSVFLSDGYTDSLDFSQIKGKTLIISVGVECPISYDNGRVKQIIIDPTD